MTFDDHDEELAPFDDNITLIPLWTNGRGILTSRHGTPVDLDAAEIPEATALVLAASSIQLTAPEDVSPAAFAASLRVFGQRLDPKGGAVHTWLQESIPAPVELLRINDTDDRVEQLLGYAVGLADDVGAALEWMEKLYDQALGAERSHAKRRSALSQWYWPELRAPFDTVLRDLGVVVYHGREAGAVSESALFAPLEAWRKTVRRCATEAVDTWAWRLPRQSGRQLLAAADAEGYFQRRLSGLCRDYDIDLDRCRDGDEDDDD